MRASAARALGSAERGLLRERSAARVLRAAELARRRGLRRRLALVPGALGRAGRGLRLRERLAALRRRRLLGCGRDLGAPLLVGPLRLGPLHLLLDRTRDRRPRGRRRRGAQRRDLLARHGFRGRHGLGDLRVALRLEPAGDLFVLELGLVRDVVVLRRLVAEHAVVAGGTEGAGEAFEGLAVVARDHPDLVRVTLRHLRQRLQVLVGQHLRRRAAGLDRGEHLLDRLRLALRLQIPRGALTLGPQDAGLPLGLGREDGGLAGTFGGEDLALLLAFRGLDRGFPLPFRGENHGALLTVGAHLLLHRVLDGGRRVDRLELDAADADAPAAGRLVEHAAQLRVDRVARGQRLLEAHATDHVAQRGRGQLLDTDDVVRDLVDRGA